MGELELEAGRDVGTSHGLARPTGRVLQAGDGWFVGGGGDIGKAQLHARVGSFVGALVDGRWVHELGGYSRFGFGGTKGREFLQLLLFPPVARRSCEHIID